MSKANIDEDDESMLSSGRVHLKVSSEPVFHRRKENSETDLTNRVGNGRH